MTHDDETATETIRQRRLLGCEDLTRLCAITALILANGVDQGVVVGEMEDQDGARPMKVRPKRVPL